MNSQEVMELMHRYLDGDLDERETTRLLEHLQQSPESAVMFERLKQLHLDLAQLPKVTPPQSIVDAILPRLEAVSSDGEQAAGKPAAQSRAERRPRIFVPWVGGVVAAAALVLVIVLRPGTGDIATNMADSGAAGMQEMALVDDASLRSMSQIAEPDGGAGEGLPHDLKTDGASAPMSADMKEVDVALTSQADSMGIMAFGDGGQAGASGGKEALAIPADGGPAGWQVRLVQVAAGVQVILVDETGEPVYVSADYAGEPVHFRWEDGHRLYFDIEMNGEMHQVSIDVRDRTEETVPLTP